MSDPTDYLASHGYWPWDAPRLPEASRQGPPAPFAPEPGTDLWVDWDSSCLPVGGPVSRSPGSPPGGSP